MARFFHPSAKIRDHFPQNDKRRLTGVVVVGEGVRRIRNKDQMCYLVRIDEVDDGTIFYISKKNFKVDTPPATPFESEARAEPVRGHDALVRDELRAAGVNVVSNVGNLSRGATREEIEELRRNGIEVDDDNEPAPENSTPQEAPPVAGVWEKPVYAGVFGQFLIKKRKYWPAGVPGDYIDAHMNAKPLGHTESFVQEMEGKRFFIHCTKDADYVTKIMSTHGVLDEIQDHVTYRLIDGQWKSFKYAEPFSRHNRAKHWVDDVNNRRHDPIGLEQVWKTKWWPNRQFTFLCSIAEVNAGQARARAKKETAMPTLEFRKNLAKLMMTNKLDDEGVSPNSPIRRRRRSSTVHLHKKRPKNAGNWNPSRRDFSTINQPYSRHKCSNCNQLTREYCQCDPSKALCRVCFGLHVQEHDD